MRLVLAYTAAQFIANLAAAGAAHAQQSTTATYTDWVLQCANTDGPAPKKICAIAQVTQVQGKNIPFSRVSIEMPTKGQAAKLTIQVPVNVTLRSPVVLQVAGKPSRLSAPFDICVPSGCFTTLDLKDDILKKLSAADEPVKIAFKDASGRDVEVPVSLKGFQAAFAALVNE